MTPGISPRRIETMRPGATSLAFGAALAVSSLLTCAPSARAIPQDDELRPPQYFQISGTCEMEIAPDKALIVGGVSSGALKPSDAVEQLEKATQLDAELRRGKARRTAIDGTRAHAEKSATRQRRQRTAFSGGAAAAGDVSGGCSGGRDFAEADRAGPRSLRRQRLEQLQSARSGDPFPHQRLRRENERLSAALRRRRLETVVRDIRRTEKFAPSQTPPPNWTCKSFNVRSKESLMRPEGGSAQWQWSMNRAQRPPEPPDLLGNCDGAPRRKHKPVVSHRSRSKP